VAGLEFLHPLAVAVLGGLVTTLFLALVVLPAAYLGVAERQRPTGAEPAEVPGPHDAEHAEPSDGPDEPRTRDREPAPA
jgi:hypothetical protein